MSEPIKRDTFYAWLKRFAPLGRGMRWPAAAFTVAALVALAVWWRVGSGAVPAPATTGASTPAVVELAVDGVASPAPSLESKRASVADASQSTPSPAALVIEVVDAESGAPVEGAQVFVEREEVDEIERDQADERCGYFGPSIAPLLGVEHRSDEHGIVRATTPGRPTRIWSSAGHRHGEVDVDAGATGARVELRQGRCLAVDVVDRFGRPASDVRVAILRREFDGWHDGPSATTNPSGRVEFDALESRFEDETEPLRIATTFVACAPVFVDFTVAGLPGGPLRLVIEDTGAVELTVTNARGEPLALPARLDLMFDNERAKDLPFGISVRERLFVPTRDGRARFERIGLRLPLTGYANLDGCAFTDRKFAGPRAADEVVRVSIPLEYVDGVVRGRLIGIDGQPLGRRHVIATVLRVYPDGSSGDSTLFHASAGEDGRFEGHRSRWFSGAVDASVTIRATRKGSCSASGQLSWPRPRIEPVPVPHEVFELGDVTAEVAPFFAGGRVLDETGEPVYSAEVYLLQSDEHEGGHWPIAIESAGEQGRFEIGFAGAVAGAALRVVADDFGPFEPVDVRRGDRDIVLRLTRAARSDSIAGTITGTILLPVGASMDDFDLDVSGVDAAGRRTRIWCATAETGAFEGNSTNAGRFRLTVSFQSVEIARVDEIELRTGESKRLDPIDVRDRVHVLRLEFVDENGVRLSAGAVHAVDPDDEDLSSATASDGIALLLSRTPRVDVFASAPGRRSMRFRGVEDGARLALPAGIVAKLRGPTLGRDSDEYELTLELGYDGEDTGGWYSDTPMVVLASDGRAQAALPLAGEYEVEEASLVNKQTAARFELTLESRPRVVIVDAASEATITLPAEALNDALRRAKQQ